MEAMVGESHEFDFGGWLRRARERSGVSLEYIARETKVSTSRVRALERNDLSGWPGGVFRRGFVRSYATLVGLDPDEAVAVFGRAFPEEEIAATCRPPAADPSLRLLLAEDTTGRRPMLARFSAAGIDLLVPMALASPSLLFGGLPRFWMVLAIIAVLYATIGTLAFGTTPGAQLIHLVIPGPGQRRRRRSRPPVQPHTVSDAAEEAPIEAEVSPAHR
jgi:transcriptional regulator with XRE-family HTH domain